MFILALIYNVLHAAALFYQVITLNVAVNSYSNALLTLLMSNQFVEIKSTVFKKFEKENLFQLTCADVVERFQLWLMLVIIGLRNIVEVGGLTVASAPQASAETVRNATIPLRSNSILPNSFTILPSWTGEVLSPFLIVLGSEMLVDWVKHAYISKFNSVKPVVYQKYLDVLAKDYYTNVSRSCSCSAMLLICPPGFREPELDQEIRTPSNSSFMSVHPRIGSNLPYVPRHTFTSAFVFLCNSTICRVRCRVNPHSSCSSSGTF